VAALAALDPALAAKAVERYGVAKDALPPWVR